MKLMALLIAIVPTLSFSLTKRTVNDATLCGVKSYNSGSACPPASFYLSRNPAEWSEESKRTCSVEKYESYNCREEGSTSDGNLRDLTPDGSCLVNLRRSAMHGKAWSAGMVAKIRGGYTRKENQHSKYNIYNGKSCDAVCKDMGFTGFSGNFGIKGTLEKKGFSAKRCYKTVCDQNPIYQNCPTNRVKTWSSCPNAGVKEANSCQVYKTPDQITEFVDLTSADIKNKRRDLARAQGYLFDYFRQKESLHCVISNLEDDEFAEDYESVIDDLKRTYRSSFRSIYRKERVDCSTEQNLTSVENIEIYLGERTLVCSEIESADELESLEKPAGVAEIDFYDFIDQCDLKLSYLEKKNWFYNRQDDVKLLLGDLAAKKVSSVKTKLEGLKIQLNNSVKSIEGN